MTTLFKKEFRQHGAFALAMICLCLLFQVAYYEQTQFLQTNVEPDVFFGLAVLMTALYAGAAAALAYSTEHAENTFGFLRKLPISLTTIALGKTSWILCGTVLVLIGNLLLGLAWTAGLGNISGVASEQIWLTFGVGIIEALVWGLFWSTRCRSQIHALLTGYACASITAYTCAACTSTFSNDVLTMYIGAVPYRLAASAIVALFAVWGMFQWFNYDAKGSALVRLLPTDLLLFRYPKRVQSPFFALVHQHVRHASILYHLGIACCILWLLGCIGVAYWIGSKNNPNYFKGELLLGFLSYPLAGVMIFFWATIFGHDQRNDSYRFFSRLGIYEGKVWWSRILPALLMYSLVLIGIFGFLFVTEAGQHGFFFAHQEAMRNIIQASSVLFSVWAIPVGVGAFISVSFRSQMVAIALSLGGMVLLGCWAMIVYHCFAFSPLWTTCPICLALLIASRLRAGYWLRETFTWRSRLIPLVPVLATLLVIVAAVPFVRVYSLPDVSWEQIDAYFDQCDSDMRRAPEKRKALLRYIVENGTFPPEYERYTKDSWRLDDIGDCTYEELLLLEYAVKRERLHFYYEAARNDKSNREDILRRDQWDWQAVLFYYMPWEAVRMDRAWRLEMVAAMARSGGLRDERAGAIRYLYEDKRHYNDAVFDKGMWDSMPLVDMIEGRLCGQRANLVIEAIKRWYAEHDKTLPESLDELLDFHLAGTPVLTELPVHPFTDRVIEYHREAAAPRLANRNIVFRLIGTEADSGQNKLAWLDRDRFIKVGGSYLCLGRFVWVLEIERQSEPRSIGYERATPLTAEQDDETPAPPPDPQHTPHT
jgi:hypothetical protein